MKKLEDAIAADIDGSDAYLVYGDWLQTQGDPRGELIALQHANKTRAAKALLAKHPSFYGGQPSECVEWHLGFWKALRIHVPDETTGAFVRAALAHPSAKFLRTLSFGRTAGDKKVDYEPVAKLLATLKPPHVRTLFFGDFEGEDWQVNWSTVGKLGPIYKAFPKLECLRIHGGMIKLGKLAHANLRELEIRTEYGLDDVVRALDNASLPKLERLDLDLGGWAYHTRPLKRIFDGQFPKLSHLVIEWINLSRDDVDALCTGKTLPKLATLSIASDALTDAKCERLLEHADRFKHLAKLDLDNNFITKKQQKLLAKLCKNVDFGAQQKHDDLYEWD